VDAKATKTASTVETSTSTGNTVDVDAVSVK